MIGGDASLNSAKEHPASTLVRMGNLPSLFLRKTRGMLFRRQIFEIHVWKEEISMIKTKHYVTC